MTGTLADGTVLKGAANLGIRPSFEPPQELLEPYFFDFDGDLYGQTIEVALIEFLRPEAKFADLDALKTPDGAGLRTGATHPQPVTLNLFQGPPRLTRERDWLHGGC